MDTTESLNCKLLLRIQDIFYTSEGGFNSRPPENENNPP